MTDKKIESEVVYEVEDSSPRKSFLKSRATKVSAITIGAALALAGSFGLGLVAGEKIAGNGQVNLGNQFGPGQGFPKGFADGDHHLPGGPDGDNGHGGFQLPNKAPAPATTP